MSRLEEVLKNHRALEKRLEYKTQQTEYLVLSEISETLALIADCATALLVNDRQRAYISSIERGKKNNEF